MYYEELMINGVMHYRSTPNGEWSAFTTNKLNTRLKELMRECEQLKLDVSNAAAKTSS